MDPTTAMPMAQGLSQLQGWLLSVLLLLGFTAMARWFWGVLKEKDELGRKMLVDFMLSQNENISTLKSLEQSYRATADRERETAENLKLLNDGLRRIEDCTARTERTLNDHCSKSGGRT
jgi:hypothetical protein